MTDTSTVAEHEHVWVPVIYGKPSWKAIEEAAAGKWILGGCMVDGKQAREGCVLCRVGRL